MSSSSISPWTNIEKRADKGRLDFRNPPFIIRVAIVATVLGVSGGLGGMMAAVFLGYVVPCTATGAVAGMLLGAMLEASGR